jgi:hypothetical protein
MQETTALSLLKGWSRKLVSGARMTAEQRHRAPPQPRRAWWRPPVMNLGDESREADIHEWEAMALYNQQPPVAWHRSDVDE